MLHLYNSEDKIPSGMGIVNDVEAAFWGYARKRGASF
jgi:hypothetical protein